MPNPFINFVFNVAGKREDMAPNLMEQENLARSERARLKREATRKRALNIKIHNDAVKLEARRGVRRPGRDHTALFETLDQLQGTFEDKKEVIRDAMEEALRFKRRALAQMLLDYIVELQVNEFRAPNAHRDHIRRGGLAKNRNVG